MSTSVFQRFSGRGDTTVAPADISGLKCTGFQSPAHDYMTDSIDLNRVLIGNRPATFYARARGNTMASEGILDGDLVMVDRSLHPAPGDIVVAWVEGEFTLRRMPGAHHAPAPDFTRVWGVVTHTIHTHRRP